MLFNLSDARRAGTFLIFFVRPLRLRFMVSPFDGYFTTKLEQDGRGRIGV